MLLLYEAAAAVSGCRLQRRQLSPAPQLQATVQGEGEDGAVPPVARLAITSALNPLRNSLAELRPEDADMQVEGQAWQRWWWQEGWLEGIGADEPGAQ